jgi:hypothetical protein
MHHCSLHVPVCLPLTAAFHRFKKMEFVGATEFMRKRAHKWTRKNFKADWQPKLKKRRSTSTALSEVTNKAPRQEREKPISKDMSVSLCSFMQDEVQIDEEEELVPIVTISEYCCCCCCCVHLCMCAAAAAAAMCISACVHHLYDRV